MSNRLDGIALDRAGLQKLIELWCEVADPVLADAIHEIGKFVARGVHAPTGVDEQDREEQWLAAAASGDPVMRQRLIETVFEVQGQERKLARATALAKFRDPRVASMLVELFTGGHCARFYSVADFWKPVFELVLACGDPRVRDATKRAWAQPRSSDARTKRESFDKRLAKWTERLEAAYPEQPPELAPDERAVLAGLVERARVAPPTLERDAATEAALLAAVYAAPADDGPRQVYADWLLERGDPRGEMIALQMRDPTDRRISDLVNRYGEAWLGPLAGIVRTVVFARGFPAKGFTNDDVSAEGPEWSTFVELRGGIPATDAFPMPVLAKATGVPAKAVVRVATLAHPPPLVELEIWSRLDDGPTIAAFDRLLPRIPLRRLELHGHADGLPPDQLRWRWRDTAIRELAVTSSFAHLGAWLDAIRDTQLDKLELLGRSSSRATITRDDRGRLAGITIAQGYSRDGYEARLEGIAAALDRMPADYVSYLELPLAKDLWTLPLRRRISTAIDRHPRIDAKEQIKTLVRPHVK